MIETKPYSLTKKIYTKIVFLKRLKNTWWLYSLLIIVGLVNLFYAKESNYFYIVFAFAYPILTFVYLYFWSNSKKQQLIFAETKMAFDENYLFFIKNENEIKIPYKNIQNIVNKESFWMLYLVKREFIYVPKTIFYSDEDLNKFKFFIKKLCLK